MNIEQVFLFVRIRVNSEAKYAFRDVGVQWKVSSSHATSCALGKHNSFLLR